jgi:unsaturated chondroitin disaccharide hydrolase
MKPPSTIRATLEYALNRVKGNCSAYGLEFPTRGYPAYATAPNDHWVAGFWPGMLWLAYHATQDSELRMQAEVLLPCFAERLEKRVDLSHDLGFLYTLTARATWLLTGSRQARDLGLRAARELGERFNPRGNYIQAWGEIGRGPDAGRMIIDCMMNLPLLYWASEETGNDAYRKVARHHAASTLRYLVRQDDSTYHTFFFDPRSGKPVGGKTCQGYADESLWTRGQAWAIYGFALTAQWLDDADFLAAAQRMADRFLVESPVDRTPLWDLRLPAGAPQYRDSSAGAIAACGLLRLARLTGDADYGREAETLVNTLSVECLETEPDRQGLLRYGAQHVPKGFADEYLIYGDYFFLEALLTLTGQAPDFWGLTGR